jgi:long-subunit fatty acid transport protein
MPPRPPRRLLAFGLAALGALLFSAAPAQASPEDVLGFGPRSIAMGATGAAGSEGYESVYGNPGLLSTARSRQLTLGFVGAVFDIHAKEKIPTGPLHGSIIGATLPLPFAGVLKDRIAIGLGFFTPTDLVVRGRILYPEKAQYPLADRVQSVAVQTGIGVDFGHGIRAGGGFAALAALSGAVLVATDASGRIGTVVEDTLVASYGPIVGLSYDLGDAWRVGATFRGELVGRFNVVITVKDLGALTVPPLNISGVAQYDPWQIALELARVKGPLRFAAGATFKHWSAYPGLREATVRCPIFDSSGQLFTDSCEARAPEKPGYSDTVAVHAGVERRFAPRPSVDMSARAGLFFEPTPAPSQTGVANVYDSGRAAISAGYGLALGAPFPAIDLDLFSQLQWLLPREHVKEVAVPATNAGAPRATVSGLLASFGMTVGARF